MAQGYTRQSTFADGDTITASLFNNEYNQLENTLFYSSTNATVTGHRHDGTAGQGGNIFKIGDLDFLNKIEVDSVNNRWGVYVEVGGVATEQVRVQDGSIVPVTTNDIDLGTGSLQFKDLFIDGTASIDSLTLSSGSTVTVILDEDDLVTNSDTALATQQSIKSYVDAQITAQDFDFSADLGGALSIDLDSESMTFTGGTGIDTAGAGNVVTFSIDSTVVTLTDVQTLTNKTIAGLDVTGDLTVDTNTLKIDSNNNRVGILNATPGVTLDIGSATDAVHVPVGTTAQRPVSAAAGYFRYNTSLQQFEGYTTEWGEIGGGGGGGATLSETLSTGNTTGGTDLAVSTGDDITFADSSKVIFGAGSDLQIYSDGTTGQVTGNVDLTGTLVVNGSTAVTVSKGTTAQRPTGVSGMFRYNTTEDKFEGYSTEWGEIGGGAADLLLNTFTGNGSDVTFTLSGASIENNTLVYVDGVYQNKSTYTVSAATPAIVTFSEAPANGAAIEIMVAAISATDIGTPSDNTVTTVKIVDGAVTTAKLADSNVTTAKLADSNVTTAKLADTSVTTAKIADDAVGADQLASDAVVTASIVDDAVTAAKIASVPITVGITTVVTATSITATVNTHVYVSAATQTITLPASPTIGQRVLITVGNFTDTVVGRNGSNIMSSATDFTMDVAYLSIQFIYTDATQGWVMS